MDDFDFVCGKCGEGFNWEDVEGKQPQVTNDEFAGVLRYKGLPDELAYDLEKIHRVTCKCGQKIVVAQAPGMTINNETGESDYAYFKAEFTPIKEDLK